MREIKFRAWDIEDKCWTTGEQPKSDDLFIESDTDMSGREHVYTITHWHRTIISQFTGFKDKNGNDVFEGDIFRIEEDDEENTMIYVVVVWVQEWAMFTTLRVEDEYQAYLSEGVDAIDETMFWTYTLEDIGSSKHYPCGNIYENPELLNQGV